MATEKELKIVLAPVLSRYANWRYSRGWLFATPISYYLRAVKLSGSWSSRAHFDIKRCVYPIFESPFGIHSSWGRSLPIPGTPSHNWNVFIPEFADKLTELINTEVMPIVEHVTTGFGFLRYLSDNYTESGWQAWGRALAYLHMGELDKARPLLVETVDALKSLADTGILDRPDSWAHNVVELLRLVDEDPAAIPAHCEAVARACVKFNKLEKFWQPVPFVYDKGLPA